MPPSLEERRPTMSPQLARRVAILGGVAFVLFGALFFRLWFLQVLSGETYVSEAAQNRVRKVRIEAPRGNIVDRDGNVLVKTRQAAVVQLLPDQLPETERVLAAEYGTKISAAERDRLAAKAKLDAIKRRDAQRDGKAPKPTSAERRERRQLKEAAAQIRDVPVPPMPVDPEVRDLFGRLGEVLNLSPDVIHQRVVEQVGVTPYAAVTVKTDISKAAFNYLLERQDQFPGIKPETQYLRQYPYHEIGAHLFGTLREIGPDELDSGDYKNVEQGERVGADGIEQFYDAFLRGRDGYYRQVVDALGESCEDPVRCAVRRVKPIQGLQLELTLDLGLQKAATAALAKYGGANPGAFVAMDPRNGEILALGSYPTYDANKFARPISQGDYNALTSEENHAPLQNRALTGTYPTGSIFKLITGTAALEEGLITPSTPVYDPGQFTIGTQVFENAGNAVNGTISFVTALTVSSDVYFYKLGAQMNGLDGQVLQTWAKRLGLGEPTGIDIPGEFAGLVPDAEWRNTGYAEFLKCAEKNHISPTDPNVIFTCGGIDKPWTIGDNVNLAVGQGDLQATPLQMAVAYSTVVNGGDVVKPHLGREVQDGQGVLQQKLRAPVRRHVDISDTTRDAIMEGLRGAASASNGTSSRVFQNLDLEVYGKTGTAERYPNADQSWYAAYVPNASRPIVVITTIEEGGFGAETAAPAACEILATWFDQDPERCVAGTSQTN